LAASDIPGTGRRHHDHYNFPGYVRSEAFNVAKIGRDTSAEVLIGEHEAVSFLTIL
jgi:hypothetical protein